MDWYSWLSKSGLDPSLASEYALLLSRNELEKADIPHFDHEFLQSMGISVAKHRLEILKLARKQSWPARSTRPMTRLLAAIHKTKKCLTRYIHSLVHSDSSAIVVVPRAPYGGGGRWRGALLNRSKRVVLKQGRLMLTDRGGGVSIAAAAAGKSNCASHSASPMVYNCPRSDDDDGFWKIEGEQIRWDSMFQDLKPT